MLILPLLLFQEPTRIAAQETTLNLVRVTDREEVSRPIPSEIVHFLPTSPNQPIPIDETDDQGRLSLQFTCIQGTKVQARPHDWTYMHSSKAFCRETMSFRVDSIETQKRLQANMDRAATHGDFAAAALAATELASMDKRETQQVAGEQAEFLSVVYAAKALGIDDGFAFDQAQSRLVMSVEMVDVVREYQLGAGLEVTGQLDYNTLSTMSKTTSGALRHKYYEPGGM